MLLSACLTVEYRSNRRESSYISRDFCGVSPTSAFPIPFRSFQIMDVHGTVGKITYNTTSRSLVISYQHLHCQSGSFVLTEVPVKPASNEARLLIVRTGRDPSLRFDGFVDIRPIGGLLGKRGGPMVEGDIMDDSPEKLLAGSGGGFCDGVAPFVLDGMADAGVEACWTSLTRFEASLLAGPGPDVASVVLVSAMEEDELVSAFDASPSAEAEAEVGVLEVVGKGSTLFLLAIGVDSGVGVAVPGRARLRFGRVGGRCSLKPLASFGPALALAGL